MKQFDTKVQKIKHEILKKVIEYSNNGKLTQCYADIPEYTEKITDGEISSCCIYKEQAIIHERVRMALGGDSNNKNMLEIIKPACEDCHAGGYFITDSCRNCISHKCVEVCKNNAISFDTYGRASIDMKKCSECGKCIDVCQYDAIISVKRPCENACELKAISINEDKIAFINSDKCISCGKCIKSCPNGAIEEKSFISDMIQIIKKSNNNEKYKVYAVVDPVFSVQYPDCKPSQYINALKKCGFADVVLISEYIKDIFDFQAGEMVDNGLVINDFCPSFINYLKLNFPNISENITHISSPVVSAVSEIRHCDKNAKVILVAPCTSMKREFMENKAVDSVVTFQETDAFLDFKGINPEDMPCDENDDISEDFYLKYMKDGSISELFDKVAEEKGFRDMRYKTNICCGIDECRTALLKNSRKISVNSYIYGSICSGGCINGSGCSVKK